MSAMSEPPRELAALSVEELRAALGRQRAVNTELRGVIATQAELHQAELAARDALIAGLRSQVAVLGDRVAQLEVQARVCLVCGVTSVGQAPGFASGRAQSGPGVHAHAANLTVANHVPVGRAAGLLGDLLGVGCSVGFVAGVRGRAAGLLEPFMARVRALLRQAGVLGVDETPGRAAGGLVDVHVACTGFLTQLHTGGRSATDIDAGGVLPGYAGTIVGDGDAGSAHLSDALHAWCGTHGLRDLRAVWEADPSGQAWAGAMADLLVSANRAAGRRGRRARRRWRDDACADRGVVSGAVAMGIADDQRRRTRAAKDGLRLARRFAEHEAMILRFATDLAVAFTNNQSERDVRPVKVQQRASGGCWRTLQGLADFAIVWSYLSTAAKWGLDKLAVLRQLFTTGPWLPPAIGPAG